MERWEKKMDVRRLVIPLFFMCWGSVVRLRGVGVRLSEVEAQIQLSLNCITGDC